MRRIIAWSLTASLGLGAANSAPAQNPPAKKMAPAPAQIKAPAPAPMDPAAIKARQEAELKSQQEMNTLLDAWEAKSKLIKSLDVGFDRIDKSKAWGDQYYEGRAMLKSPDLACLQFTKVKTGPDDKPLFTKDKNGKSTWIVEPSPDERIVCNGKEVLQYQYEKKVVYVFPLDKQNRLKALQQGPLPFLFNMKAADVKMRYGMTLVNANETDYIISIIPREDIDKESFSKAFIALNKKTFLPSRLKLYPSQGEKDTQDYYFADPEGNWAHRKIQANQPMDDGYFQAVTKIDKWKTIINPGPEEISAQGSSDRAPVAQPKRQAAQPAVRPQGR